MRSGQEQDEGGVRTYETETALDVLKKRYAAGEISREEYLEMRRDLET
jgi:putative membrane protein